MLLFFSDNSGNTPLLEAVKNGHDRIASLLSDAGALLVIDDAGDFLCKIVARKDLEFLKRVVANGINPNSKNYDHRTPLHIAAAEGLLSFAKLLIEAGASVFIKDRYHSCLSLRIIENSLKVYRQVQYRSYILD